MKLYATTTSERASKGQGGNEHVNVKLENETREELAYIRAIPDGTNTRVTVYVSGQGHLGTFYVPNGLKDKTKGNKQKGETCRPGHPDLLDTICPQCGFVA